MWKLFGIQQDRPDVFIGQHRFGLQAPWAGTTRCRAGCGFMIPSAPPLRQIIFDEMGELVVHEFQLGFVDADDEGRQPDARSSILLLEPEHAAPH